nr:cytochrome C oxidase copper chaperone 1-like [Ipomoea batatas]GMC76643.1 cytochrome C oxidase copper chaperone 1-like [Ipomoea batatas]
MPKDEFMDVIGSGLPFRTICHHAIFTMGGVQIKSSSCEIALPKSPEDKSPATSMGPDSKPKKKICCACPDTKKLRDECIVEHGESACKKWIEAHRKCLRAEGFNV